MKLEAKKCKKCGELKPLVSCFAKCSTGKDGYRATCKTCSHKQMTDGQINYMSKTW